MLPVLAAVAALGCTPAGRSVATIHEKETTVPIPPQSLDPFEGVFPPTWHVGDRWRVAMSSVFQHAGEQDFRTIVYARAERARELTDEGHRHRRRDRATRRRDHDDVRVETDDLVTLLGTRNTHGDVDGTTTKMAHLKSRLAVDAGPSLL